MEMWGLAAPPVPVLSHTAWHRHKAQRSLGGEQTPAAAWMGIASPVPQHGSPKLLNPRQLSSEHCRKHSCPLQHRYAAAAWGGVKRSTGLTTIGTDPMPPQSHPPTNTAKLAWATGLCD